MRCIVHKLIFKQMSELCELSFDCASNLTDLTARIFLYVLVCIIDCSCDLSRWRIHQMGFIKCSVQRARHPMRVALNSLASSMHFLKKYLIILSHLAVSRFSVLLIFYCHHSLGTIDTSDHV